MTAIGDMASNIPSAVPRSALRTLDLFCIITFALGLRILLFNGAFGSDDVVYYGRALEIARGIWTTSNYNGSLRYGFNLPAGMLMALFGTSQAAANLWPLLCSLTEIMAVAVFGAALGGRFVGVAAGLLLASAPLHIAVATRIHADPVVSCSLTVGVVLLYFGWHGRSAWLLLAAGLALGWVFWTKELAAVTYFGLLPMLYFFRGRWRDVVWVIAGVLVMLALHGLLMWRIAGDPLHLVRVVLGALKHNFIDAGDGNDSAGYYFRYLTVDPRHTGLLGWLGLTGLVILAPRLLRHESLGVAVHPTAAAFLLAWLVGLLLVLSVFPVSLSPLRFTMKQSNYISLFLAPLALAAAITVNALPRVVARATLAVAVLLGVLLGALQQADYRTFTANSKAVAEFAVGHPHALIVGSTNNSALGTLWARLKHPGAPSAAIASFRDTIDQPVAFAARKYPASAVYAVLDQQTMNWFAGDSPVTRPMGCWQPLQTLAPSGLGPGNALAAFLARAIRGSGNPVVQKVATAFDHLAHPTPAELFFVPGRDPWCGDVPHSVAPARKP